MGISQSFPLKKNQTNPSTTTKKPPKQSKPETIPTKQANIQTKSFIELKYLSQLHFAANDKETK